MGLWVRAAAWVRGEPWWTVEPSPTPAHRTLNIPGESRVTEVRR